ncbi:hypothetical protein B7R22_14205 [Subtercola boreus]|uniref:Uncharacterized protein n=1 Tax=Subtercola boreus TaxID=120213 RepID=A0A3E0VWC7_9MICO|nr:hypothetical protein [Subtercola boreus]RFA13147.1 hypothetical protein B7R22_14205 [Subtercola boreus]
MKAVPIVTIGTLLILRPLIGLVVLSTTADTTGADATVVSTGILPIRVAAVGGNHADLISGQAGTLTVPTLVDTSQYHLSSALNLSVIGWVILIAVCAIPLLWTIIVGLPADPEDNTALTTTPLLDGARRNETSPSSQRLL